MMKPRWAWGLVAGAAAAAIIFAVLRLGPSDGPTPPASGSRQSTTVQRTNLTVTRTVDGEVALGPSYPVASRLSGTVTWLPSRAATVRRGQRLFAVDGRPVILLYGAVPAYRDLAVGSRGTDVRQLEQNLTALGFEGFEVDGRFTRATRRAVIAWQDRLGLPETGSVELGRVVFVPEPLMLTQAETAVGQPVAEGAAIGSFSGTRQHVSVDLERDLAQLARPGTTVSVVPFGRPAVTGQVVAVEPQSTPARSESSSAGGEQQTDEERVTVSVAVADQSKLSGLTGTRVQVRLTGERRTGVLAVPIEALLALRDGGYGLEAVDAAEISVIKVQTGLFAAGMVEVSGTGLTAGLRVGMAAR